MSHAITANKPHAIVNVTLAIAETDGDNIADGLNELLRDHLSTDFLADYMFCNTDEPVIKISSNEPEEGELFETVKLNSEELITLAAAVSFLEKELAYVEFDDINKGEMLETSKLWACSHKFNSLSHACITFEKYNSDVFQVLPEIGQKEHNTLTFALSHFIAMVDKESRSELSDGYSEVIFDKDALKQLRAKIDKIEITL